ncbi:putative bifunctional diguanylate cyclase/phosphodiesterase [Nitrincola tapanii]|uniref:cyclic-guanylate-specific phosphodiesterase n=1 Tax=Nitrincola tapanii TaxID=1708751 RepID=A0A5A9W6P4_9GAMM|nr:EAL domain-containing protein [Nitrincola tapanii]KAA0876386.1 EAL domain-containing protein [Nitrincola tapanii]
MRKLTTDLLRQRILRFAAFSILLTGLLVASATVFSLYREVRGHSEQQAAARVLSQMQTLDQLFSRFDEVARQISSRTQIREALSAFNQGEMTLEALQTFTLPRLMEPLRASEDALGLLRMDQLGQEVVRTGEVPPEAAQRALLAVDDAATLVRGFWEAETGPSYLVASDIRDPEGRLVGRDLILFGMQSLLQWLEAQSESGESLHLIYLPSMQRISAQDLPPLLALRLSEELPNWRGQTQGLYKETDLDRVVFYHTLQEHPDWMLLSQHSHSQLYASTMKILAWPLMVTLLLLAAGVLVTALVMRPLLARLSDAYLRQREAEQQIHQLINFDRLTGLPNWLQLYERLHQKIEQAQPQEKMALLFLNLDRFKAINESLGHQSGDQLLRLVAARLRAFVGQDEALARSGGDEFLFLYPYRGSDAQVEAVAQRLLAAFQMPFELEGREVHMATTLGISLFPRDARSPEDLLKHADTALIRAKEQGRKGFQFYQADMSQSSRERFELEADLRIALEQQSLQIYYQPQVCLASNQIVGVEALIRWPHPEKGMIPPDRFIGLAEENGLIHPLGAWVLRRACEDAARWYQQGYALRVSVNVSARQLNRSAFVSQVAEVLQKTGLPAKYLELELTETYLFENFTRSARVLRRLQQLGVSLALDDFGTGYSSLNYLRRLRLPRLKIDRSFISGLPENREDLVLVSTILAMAQSLGMKVVAEGVETDAQRQCLADLQCHEYQGYFYARPETCAELEARLMRLSERA